MNERMLKTIDDIRERHQERLDGGAGSGNWGHVGRPGEWGGSAPGGGAAFRLSETSKKGSSYTSQAKQRGVRIKALSKANNVLKKAMSAFKEHPSAKHKRALVTAVNKVQKALKKCENVNMKQKTVDKSKYEKNPTKYFGVKTPNSNASKDILSDKKRGATIHGKERGFTGTRESVHITFPGMTKKGAK